MRYSNSFFTMSPVDTIVNKETANDDETRARTIHARALNTRAPS